MIQIDVNIVNPNQPIVESIELCLSSARQSCRAMHCGTGEVHYLWLFLGLTPAIFLRRLSCRLILLLTLRNKMLRLQANILLNYLQSKSFKNSH